MKKNFKLLMGLMMVASLAGCGAKTPSNISSNANSVSTPVVSESSNNSSEKVSASTSSSSISTSSSSSEESSTNISVDSSTSTSTNSSTSTSKYEKIDLPESILGLWSSDEFYFGSDYENPLHADIIIVEEGLVFSCEAESIEEEFEYLGYIEDVDGAVAVFENENYGEFYVLEYGPIIYVECEELNIETQEFSKPSEGAELPEELIGTWVNENAYAIELGVELCVTIVIEEDGTLTTSCDDEAATPALNCVYSFTEEYYGYYCFESIDSDDSLQVLLWEDELFINEETSGIYDDDSYGFTKQ